MQDDELHPIWAPQNQKILENGSGSCKLIQEFILLSYSVSDVISLLKHINTSSGTWDEVIALVAVLCHPYLKEDQIQFSFTWKRQ